MTRATIGTLDTSKRYLVLRSAPRRFHGRHSHRTLWYLTPKERCKDFTLRACDALGVQLVSQDNLDREVYLEALTMDQALKRADSLGYATLTYQALVYWLKRINKYNEVMQNGKTSKSSNTRLPRFRGRVR